MITNNFIKTYNDRCEALLSDLHNLTVEEARKRYKALWDGCPPELHIDDFSVIKKLESHFKDFHIEGVTKVTFSIPVSETKPIDAVSAITDVLNDELESVIVFPHIRYLPIEQFGFKKSKIVKKKFIGDDDGALTNGKVYEFRQAYFSPNPQTEYRKVWVTKSDFGPYVRYEDTKQFWVNIK